MFHDIADARFGLDSLVASTGMVMRSGVAALDEHFAGAELFSTLFPAAVPC